MTIESQWEYQRCQVHKVTTKWQTQFSSFCFAEKQVQRYYCDWFNAEQSVGNISDPMKH